MSEQKPRRFKLRNGAVVEENKSSEWDFVGVDGFMTEYIFLTPVHPWQVNESLCLILAGNEFPKGGAHGPGYDIIEEIFPEEQN